MSDMPSIPVSGQDPWDADLNACLEWMHGSIEELQESTGGGASPLKLITITESVALTREHMGSYLYFQNKDPITVTIPQNASSGLAMGDWFYAISYYIQEDEGWQAPGVITFECEDEVYASVSLLPMRFSYVAQTLPQSWMSFVHLQQIPESIPSPGATGQVLTSYDNNSTYWADPPSTLASITYADEDDGSWTPPPDLPTGSFVTLMLNVTTVVLPGFDTEIPVGATFTLYRYVAGTTTIMEGDGGLLYGPTDFNTVGTRTVVHMGGGYWSVY